MPCFCCKNPLKACGICASGLLVFSYIVPIGGDGVYVLELDFVGTLVRIQSQSLSAGQPLEFDLSTVDLNENYTYTGRIIKPSGEVLEFQGTDEVLDCLTIKTAIGGASFVDVQIP